LLAHLFPAHETGEANAAGQRGTRCPLPQFRLDAVAVGGQLGPADSKAYLRDALNSIEQVEQAFLTNEAAHEQGAERPTVLPCTLIAYDRAFEMGSTLAAAATADGGMFTAGAVKLCHPHCSKFCVLGGGSC
jgi:hypothetical protein